MDSVDSKYKCIENGAPKSQFNGINHVKRKSTVKNVIKSPEKKFKFSDNNENIEKSVNKSNNINISNGNSTTTSIAEQRQLLPIFPVRQSFLKIAREQPSLIVIGETGSGKTTQVPQYLHEAGFTETGTIAVTQPRRVAAITIAKRVAQERKCNIGGLVGYTVRFEDTTSNETKICYMTDGSLLREALSDSLLKAYSVIILDEAHERTINTDVLFGIVKNAQRLRLQKYRPLKIIIMSATMDVDHFSKYFNNCKIVYLEGRTYPVRIMHAAQPQSDYVNACLSTLLVINETAPADHDVLIFLTGQDEIEAMKHQIQVLSTSKEIKGPPIRTFPLYSQLPGHRQLEAFRPVSAGCRKVILSTNVAETSLTIGGIKFVIDSGMVKRRMYEPHSGVETLKIVKISQDQAWQRSGRAGRESAGTCYRTYSLDEYEKASKSIVPEILRSNITTTVLQLLALGINVLTFDFMDIPSPDAIKNALKQLHLLGAVTGAQSIDLTDIGRKMSKFPLDPRFSKMLLIAPEYNCLEEMLSLIAVISGDNVFYSNSSFDTEKKAAQLTAHTKFQSEYGDYITLLNVFQTYEAKEKPKQWCSENFLNKANLFYAKNVRKQLKEICERLGLKITSCGSNTNEVRKCILAGLFGNVAQLQRDNIYMAVASRLKAKIHPSSVMHGRKPNLIVFAELVSTANQMYMRMITSIESLWIDEILPNNAKSLIRIYN